MVSTQAFKRKILLPCSTCCSLSNFSTLTDKWGKIKKRWRGVEMTNWIISKKEIKDCRRWYFYRPQHIFSLRLRLLISGAVILPLGKWCCVCLSDMSRHHVSSWYCHCSLRHGHGFSISLSLSHFWGHTTNHKIRIYFFFFYRKTQLGSDKSKKTCGSFMWKAH